MVANSTILRVEIVILTFTFSVVRTVEGRELVNQGIDVVVIHAVNVVVVVVDVVAIGTRGNRVVFDDLRRCPIVVGVGRDISAREYKSRRIPLATVGRGLLRLRVFTGTCRRERLIHLVVASGQGLLL